MESLSGNASDLVDRYNKQSSALISILNEIQESHGYLPFEMLDTISRELRVSLAKIFGVITFYSQFKLNKPGKYNIRACHGTACFVKNAKMLTNALKFEYAIEKSSTTEDGIFSLEEVSCLGACALAPVVDINGEINGELDVGKIKRMIKRIRRKEGLD